MNNPDFSSWQSVSFLVVGAIGFVIVLSSLFASSATTRRWRTWLMIGLSSVAGSAAGLVGVRYFAHYLTSIMACLGCAALVADLLMAKLRIDSPKT